ncbi:ribose transport system permease protein [Lachnospiraceae bacterium PF1-21]|uniref:ABC transporter permease n=1 Tax=Ohessyouella blattaphilus TaxID=2949333 RepID=A0ABT1EFC6_9FIRM|nr:ABC transporter permease [Ohessyouella blattaphilus]MCP1109404.1 ABC transporter permease [Ohessyouella blattaphilus]MCR8562798.1 ABC transporter permease [Ohessyouella blattaphilus]MDL2249291.1 ABC transporter permease [Lachnospiraceae bacterium OttesenSCG-928-J05]
MSKGKGKFKLNSNVANRLGSLGALLVLGVVLSFATDSFLTQSNIMNIFKQTSVNALISTGMLVCLITAGIDLSVGANAIFCTCMMGMLLQKGVTNPLIMIAVGVFSGLFIGFINGTLLTRLHLPHPFVSTLGMKNVLWGLALLVVNSQIVSGFPAQVTWLGSATIPSSVPLLGGFPISFILVIAIFLVMGVFLSKTALGRSIYCVGGSPEAARLSGIQSANVLTFCYTLSGFMSALAAIVLIGRGGIANGANAIQPYDTDAIAACIIGGASFSGGKGTMSGTLIGALIITVIRNGLQLLSVSTAVQNIVIGLVIILAVLLDVTRERVEANARRLAAV